jgi:N-glycosylase/DNA lyase
LTVDKTTHGSNSTIIDEFNEYRTKGGEFWLRGGYMTIKEQNTKDLKRAWQKFIKEQKRKNAERRKH